MRNNTHRAMAALSLAALATLAQAGDAQTSPTTLTTAVPANTAAPMAAQVVPPLNAAGEGRREYLKLNCYSCHGMRAQGGMGPNIVHAESGDVNEAVMQGEEGGMISFSHYATKVDTKHLTAYLKSIGTPGEPTFNDWWVANPTK
jgi:mono/diheme cytochrome c family protein